MFMRDTISPRTFCSGGRTKRVFQAREELVMVTFLVVVAVIFVVLALMGVPMEAAFGVMQFAFLAGALYACHSIT